MFQPRAHTVNEGAPAKQALIRPGSYVRDRYDPLWSPAYALRHRRTCGIFTLGEIAWREAEERFGDQVGGGDGGRDADRYAEECEGERFSEDESREHCRAVRLRRHEFRFPGSCA